MSKKDKTRYRSVFISDVHLGTKDCQAEKLLAFLSSIQCEHLFLAGDIVDVWALRRKWFWPKAHSNVVRKLLKRDVKGTNITYVPGNHDELFRDYHKLEFGGVKILTQARHKLADGRTLMVMHGDEFDAVVTNARLITAVGDWLYYVLLFCNRVLNHVRRKLGFGYWSLAGFIKSKVKSVLQFVGSYEKCVAKCAREKKVDIIVCGHIHRPEIREMDGVLYCNCGDWVENCTAIVETYTGELKLVSFADVVPDGEAAHDGHEAQEAHETARMDGVGRPSPQPATTGQEPELEPVHAARRISRAYIEAVLANDAIAAMIGSTGDLEDLQPARPDPRRPVMPAQPSAAVNPAGQAAHRQPASSAGLVSVGGPGSGQESFRG